MPTSMEFRRELLSRLIRDLNIKRDKAKDKISIPKYNQMCIAITELQDLEPGQILKAIEVLVDNNVCDDETEAKAYMFNCLIWDSVAISVKQ